MRDRLLRAAARLRTALRQLVARLPRLRRLARRLRFRAHAGSRDVAVYADGTLAYDPEVVLACEVAILPGILGHELLHVALGHHARVEALRPRTAADRVRANRAADLVANGICQHAGLALPQGALLAGALGLPEGRTLEAYYQELCKVRGEGRNGAVGQEVFCPDCALPLPGKGHAGSRACRARIEARRLLARGLVTVEPELRGVLRAMKATLVSARTADGGRKVQAWTTPAAQIEAVALHRIGDFLERPPLAVLRAASGARCECVALARDLEWTARGTRPARLLCRCAALYGGVLAWGGARFYLDGTAEVHPNGTWERVTPRILRALEARMRAGAEETPGERSVRLTYRRRA